MKAAVLTLDGFEIQDVERPTVGPDEVLIKTQACGICSGDLFVYQNRPDFYQTYNRLGHEASGEIIEIGRNVTAFKLGDMVTALALPAYSQYFAAPANRIVKLPSQVDPKIALGEAVACCIHAAGRFGIKPGDNVAVIGLGFMGQICLQLAKYQGAGFICAIDPVAERRELSKHFGADATFNPLESTGQEILDSLGEFDVVIEAAGVQSAIDLSTELVAIHGRIVLVGYHQSNNGMRSINIERWNYKAIDVVNGHVRNEDEKTKAMELGMQLIEKGHISTKELIAFYDFDQIDQAFQELDGRKTGLLKAVLLM